jgi:chromosome segregation ATPase
MTKAQMTQTILRLQRSITHEQEQTKTFREKWPILASRLEQSQIEEGKAQAQARDAEARARKAENDAADWKNRAEAIEHQRKGQARDLSDALTKLSNLHQKIEARDQAIVAVAIELAELRTNTTWQGA